MNLKPLGCALAALLVLWPSLPRAAQEAPGNVPREGKEVLTPSGLRYTDLKVGQGDEARPGRIVEIHYTGWLEGGARFDANQDSDPPLKFKLGEGQVIKGWDEGIAGMKVGGKRRLIVPADLGYGQQGAGSVVPPDATLRYEIELLSVR